MSKSPREQIREFLQSEFAPRAREVRARTVRVVWSALSLIVAALIVALLHVFPAVSEHLRHVSDAISQLFPSLVSQQTYLSIQQYIEWVPPVLGAIAVLLVTRLISGLVAQLFLKPSKIELEYDSYQSFPLAKEKELQESTWPELASFVRHAYYEVWNSKVGEEQGLPAEFSAADANRALTGSNLSKAIGKRVEYLESYCSGSRKRNGQRPALRDFTDRWLGIRPGRGFHAAIVWLLCFSLLVASLPRPVMLAATADMKANVRELSQKTDGQGIDEFASEELPELLGEPAREENEEFDEKKPILEAVETEADQFLDASFDAGAAESDYEAFANSAPLLNNILSGLEGEADEDVSDVAKDVKDSIVVGLAEGGPLTREERQELEDEVKAAEELAKRVAAGEVSDSEARAVFKDARANLRRAAELRAEAEAEEKEADRLDEEADKAEEDANSANGSAEKSNQDAKTLEDDAGKLEDDAKSLQDEADNLDKEGAAKRLRKEAADLEAKAKELRESAKKNEDDSMELAIEANSKSKEADELERQAKEENDAEKRTKAATARSESQDREAKAKEKRKLAEKQKVEAKNLEEEAKRKTMKAAELEKDRPPTTDPETIAKADKKREAAAEKKRQADEKRKQAEAKRKEAQKKKAEAEAKKKEAEQKRKEAEKKRNSSKKKKRSAWKLGLKAAIALAALAIHPALGIAALWMMLSGKDAGTGGGEGGGDGDGKGKGDKPGEEKPGTPSNGNPSDATQGEGTQNGATPSGGSPGGADSGKDAPGEGAPNQSGSGEGDKQNGDKSGDMPGNKPASKPGDTPGDKPSGDTSSMSKANPSNRIDVKSFSGTGKDIFWEKRSDGRFICLKTEGENSKVIGVVSSELSKSGTVHGVQYYPDAPGGSYIIASVGSTLYRASSKGESTQLLNIGLDEVLDRDKKEVTEGGKRVLRLMSQLKPYAVVHSTRFERMAKPNEAPLKVTAWFLYRQQDTDAGALAWVLEPDDAEQRNLPVADKSVREAFGSRLNGEILPNGLSGILNVLARKSHRLPPDSLDTTVPLLSFSTSNEYRLVTATPVANRYAVSVFQSDWDEEHVRATVTERTWTTMREAQGSKQLRSISEKLLFGDQVADELTHSSAPKSWYDDGWTIASAQLNVPNSIAVLLVKKDTTGGVTLRFLAHSNQGERIWRTAPFKEIQARYDKQKTKSPAEYRDGKHGQVKFSSFDSLDPAIIDAWVIRGDPGLNKDYPAWAKDDKSEVNWLFDPPK